jgi:hypothetical protein
LLLGRGAAEICQIATVKIRLAVIVTDNSGGFIDFQSFVTHSQYILLLLIGEKAQKSRLRELKKFRNS